MKRRVSPDSSVLRAPENMTDVSESSRVADSQEFRLAMTCSGGADVLPVCTTSLEAGIYSADTASLKFQQVACGGVPCLAATGSALLGCGERARNGFVAGRSVDQGQSFTVLLDAPCLAPATCGVSTSAGAACAADWPRVSAQLNEGGARCNQAAASKPFSRACFTDAARAGVARGDKVLPQTGTRRRGAGCGCTLSASRAARHDAYLQWVSLLLAVVGLRARRASLLWRV